MTQGAGQPGVEGPARPDADQVEPVGGGDQLPQGLGGDGQFGLGSMLAAAGGGGIVEVGVLRDLGQALAQPPEQVQTLGQVLVRVAGQVAAALDLPRPLDQGQTQTLAVYGPGLADATLVEADEVRRLPVQTAEQDLTGLKRTAQPVGQGKESCGAHSPPPKTETRRNRQGGAAWPT